LIKENASRNRDDKKINISKSINYDKSSAVVGESKNT
jgi:hypothetical protein